ncbi:hypothetical protein ACX0G7_09780 [Flavitalea antarctica]
MDKQLTPEEIFANHNTNWQNNSHSDNLSNAAKAMTEYASQQTAALQARVQELENQWKNRSTDYEIAMNRIAELNQHVLKLAKDKEQLYSVIVGHENTIIDRESRIAELEREIEQNQESWDQGRNEISTLKHHLTKSQQHAETLMGLLEEIVRSTGGCTCLKCQKRSWELYKQEHGLQSSEKTNYIKTS